jgi:hypothetical protein
MATVRAILAPASEWNDGIVDGIPTATTLPN